MAIFCNQENQNQQGLAQRLHKHKDGRNVNQTWRSQNLINSDKSQEIKPKFNQTFADYPKREDSSDIGRFGGGDIEKDDIEEDDFEEDTNFSSGKIPFSIKREKIALTISLNKLTKFHISPIFINFHIHFDGFGLLT